MGLRVATITLAAVCLLIFTSVAHALDCDAEGFPTSRDELKHFLKEGASLEQIQQLCSQPGETRQKHLWGLIVSVFGILLLIPPLTAGMWDVERGILRKLHR